MEQADRSHRRRPVLVALDAVQELLGVLIAVLCGSSQIVDGFVIVTVDLSAVEVQLAELVFSEVISVLRGDLEVFDGSEDILDIFLGQSQLACEVCGVGIVLTCGSFEVVDGSLQVFRNNLTLREQFP